MDESLYKECAAPYCGNRFKPRSNRDTCSARCRTAKSRHEKHVRADALRLLKEWGFVAQDGSLRHRGTEDIHVLLADETHSNSQAFTDALESLAYELNPTGAWGTGVRRQNEFTFEYGGAEYSDLPAQDLRDETDAEYRGRIIETIFGYSMPSFDYANDGHRGKIRLAPEIADEPDWQKIELTAIGMMNAPSRMKTKYTLDNDMPTQESERLAKGRLLYAMAKRIEETHEYCSTCERWMPKPHETAECEYMNWRAALKAQIWGQPCRHHCSVPCDCPNGMILTAVAA